MNDDKKRQEGMRWLDEDERNYRHAAAKLKLEELNVQKEKELVRQYRKRQRRILVAKITGKTSKLIVKAKAAYTPRRAVISGVVGLIVLSLLVGGLSLSHKNAVLKKRALQQAGLKPDFTPVTPDNKSATNITTTENNNQKIVSYQDTYNKVTILVNQQKLPETFLKDPSKIKDLANAPPFASPESKLEELDTSKGKLYLVTYSAGQQRSLMAYGNIMIFFQTSQKLGDKDWYDYIDKLTVK